MTDKIPIKTGAILSAVLLAFGCSSSNNNNNRTTATPVAFERASLFVESNFADEDAEIVIAAEGGDFSLARLEILDPNGRRVLSMVSTDPNSLGIEAIQLESPEPDLTSVLSAYPEGTYRFLGEATDGTQLESSVMLSHELPAPAQITFPVAGSTTDVSSGLTVTWTPSTDVVAQSIGVDNEDLGTALSANVEADTTTFDVLPPWLMNGVDEYAVAVETVAANGNRSVDEIKFTATGGTAPTEDTGPDAPPEFDAGMFIERIEVDNDAQVVVAVDAEEGVSRLEMLAPDGSPRVVFEIDDQAGLGMRKIEFATPEPTLEALQVAYPTGSYAFSATNAAGSAVGADADLGHELLALPEVLSPANGATVSVSEGLLIDWEPVDGAVGYAIGLEEGELGGPAHDAELPPDVTSFQVPASWIQPGIAEYVLDVNAIGENGNNIVTEVRFATAP